MLTITLSILPDAITLSTSICLCDPLPEGLAQTIKYIKTSINLPTMELTLHGPYMEVVGLRIWDTITMNRLVPK